MSEVAKGELELSEAVENIVVDTAKVGATSAATGLFKFSAEAMVKQTADKLKNEAIKKSLEKFSTTGGVGAAVTLFVATGKTVGKYLSGELDEKEMIIELGEQGSGLVSLSETPYFLGLVEASVTLWANLSEVWLVI